MLWKFGFASSSMIDTLLTRDTRPSMEELMDEQDILSECKALNNRLVLYLSSESAVTSLLHWVIAGLDELDQEAAAAASVVMDHAASNPELYPSYGNVNGQSATPLGDIPKPGPGSPPLEPAKLAEETTEGATDSTVEDSQSAQDSAKGIGLGEGLSRYQSRDDSARSRYPQIATEILTSEVWTIHDTIMENPGDILTPFWDAVLPPVEVSTPSTESSMSRLEISERERMTDEFRSEKDEERDRKRELIRGMWTRVNGWLITRKPKEMMDFIKTLPNIVERIVARIASPAVQDLLIRMVSSEEAGAIGVIDWLASEGLMARLLANLSPEHPPSMHSICADLLKSIITLCAPSPFNPAGGNGDQQSGQQVQPPGKRNNRLIRDLVSEANVNLMLGSALDDVELSDQDWRGVDPDGSHPADPFIVHPLPSLASASSSLSAICNILVELIRRNNSDFSEPHLFHTLRNGLFHIRMSSGGYHGGGAGEDEIRAQMEESVAEMSASMGIVHLGALLSLITERFEKFNSLLLNPRTQDRSASTQTSKPLTLERFRVIELYAELLHSSNMSILNRPNGMGPSYTPDGILLGGLQGLDALSQAIEGDGSGEGDEEGDPEAQITQAKELPVSSSSAGSLSGSEVGSDDEEILRQEAEEETTPSPSPAASGVLHPELDTTATPKASHQPLHAASPPSPTLESPTPPPTSQEDAARLRNVMGIETGPSSPSPVILEKVATTDTASHIATAANTKPPSVISEPRSDHTASIENVTGDQPLPPGDKLKQTYIEHKVLRTIVEIFFEYPNNDFMHHVVYDLLQQILNGRLGAGWNRELVVDLICEAELIDRIVRAQAINDETIKKHRTPRLAFMGHIVLIAEELVKFFDRCPPELLEAIKPHYDADAWERFVQGSLQETKDRDTRPLAGGKPEVMSAMAGQMPKEEDSNSSDEEEDMGTKASFGEPLTRTKAQDGFASRRGFDSFADREAEEDEMYWGSSGRKTADSSDEEEDDAGWLRPSVRTFDSQSSDDDDFGAFQTTEALSSPETKKDDFEDDEAWGSFASSTNPEDPDNPFDDDNFAIFAPSVPPQRIQPTEEDTPHDPLTPHDWASKFDREFNDDTPVMAIPPGRPDIVVPNTDADSGPERQIVVPEFEDSPVATRASAWAASGSGPMSPTTASGSSGEWTLAGKDADTEMEDLSLPSGIATTKPATSDAVGNISADDKSDETDKPPAATTSQPKAGSSSSSPSLSPSTATSSILPKISYQTRPSNRRLGTSPTSPITIPQRSPKLSASPDIPITNLSISPVSTLSPRLLASSPKVLRPRSTSTGTSSPPFSPQNKYRKPPPPPPSSRRHVASSSVDSGSGSGSSLGTSPGMKRRRSSFGSPPDRSLIAAASKEAPLGPGVSLDTHMTLDGMVEREIDGKKVIVPADEIILGVEEAQNERQESL